MTHKMEVVNHNPSSNMRIVSFNCAGFKSSKDYICNSFLRNTDIIALQETWLMPHEISLPGTVSDDFHSFSTSSVNVGDGLLRGRPFGGLTFLWNKKLSKVARIINYDDNRLLGLLCDFDERSVLFLNVYLPTQSPDNYDEFMSYVGKIVSIANDPEIDAMCILGDFNAFPGSGHFRELENACLENDLVIADVAALPVNSYTHVNNNSSSCSWIDHVVVSRNVVSNFKDYFIRYGTPTSDHFPMGCTFCPGWNMIADNDAINEDRISWDFRDENKKLMFRQLLEYRLERFELLIPFCNGVDCVYDSHCLDIEMFYSRLRKIILEVAESVFGRKSRNRYVVPGWNVYVSEAHEEARRDFLYWRSVGSPREGPVAFVMRRSRSRFKLALRECKREESRMRAEALAAKMLAGNSSGFWHDIHNMCPQRSSRAGRIDNAIGDQEVVALWKSRFESILNSVVNDALENEVRRRCSENGTPVVVSVRELEEVVKHLPANKAIGADGIPGEVYKFAPRRLLVLISIFLSACFNHQYIPEIIMKVIVIPLLKNKLKDPSASDNYRPIAIATSFSKVIELVMLDRMKNFLSTQDNQFGFKKDHSTDMCILLLKDVIGYYRSLQSPVFICFLDIKKAYDRVNHFNLFTKLLDRGVPVYLVKLLSFWYRNQSLQVKWGLFLSRPFKVTNGIRQGSLLSPHLFNVYVDDLSSRMNESKVGCHVSNKCVNHLSYADDMVLIAPSFRALQKLLDICTSYASDHDIIYNTRKSVCMMVWPKKAKLTFSPSFCLAGERLDYVSEFLYLGHSITNDLSDDQDMKRMIRSLYSTGNMIIRKFSSCDDFIKISLFKTYCYNLYCSALWCNFKVGTWRKIKVCHNDIFRNLLGMPRYHSASFLFVSNRVNNIDILIRRNIFSLKRRFECSLNALCIASRDSEIRVHSPIWKNFEVRLRGGESQLL